MNYSEKDKILILYAAYGDGHKQVANAISEAVSDTLADAEPIILDIMEWIYPSSYPISHYLYITGIKKFPQLYSFLYQKTRVKNSFSITLNSFFLKGMHSMFTIIQELKPKVVVSTYPLAAGIISKLKEQGLIDIPAVTIITDYTDHSYWIHPFTDQYVVGASQMRDRIISLGVEEFKIKHSGIPVRKRFIETQSKELLIEKYKIDPQKFTILIMGGGDGFIRLSTFQAMESEFPTLQLIIVCGRNIKLKKRLEHELKDSKHDIRVMGYCEHVQELMAISDIMISKAGGVTISEAITMELPLLIYNVLPGQEEDNANYLKHEGLAFLAESKKELIGIINNVVRDSKPLKMMKQRIKQHQTKTSSLAALDVIVGMINREHT